MNRKAKILLSFLAVIAVLVYFIVSASIIGEKESDQRCTDFSITVSEADERSLVTREDIKSILLNDTIKIMGEPIHAINIHAIEELLLSKSYIKNAKVYTDIAGILHIDIKQRKPIIRVNTRGSGFYMDEAGFVFPLSKSYTDYVPIVTGNPPLPFSIGYKGSMPDTESANFIRSILTFAHFLEKNSYWNSMIEQIHVISENDVELIPRVGSHVVKLGGLGNFEHKLRKLDIFYRNGMPTVGWNTYKMINLEYGNQVVCK